MTLRHISNGQNKSSAIFDGVLESVKADTFLDFFEPRKRMPRMHRRPADV
jgi:hypothetical protein